MNSTAPTLVTHEAYVYDGWNMVATYALKLTGSNAGKADKRLASHVWGPDIGSRLEARRDWQSAGGVGGLLFTLYPSPPTGAVPTYTQWLANQGVIETTQIGYIDPENDFWVPYSGPYTEPFYDENGYYIAEYGGYSSPYGFIPYEISSGYSYAYPFYENSILTNHKIHVPVMDHMGNVTSVIRLQGVPGNGSTAQAEFLYDYDAFGKEIRSTALIAGSNPDSYPFHFSTKYTDAETGMVYYGYRFYDPANGRWINRDPIEENGGLNLYVMVKNVPVLSLDRLGLKDCTIKILVGHNGKKLSDQLKLETDPSQADSKNFPTTNVGCVSCNPRTTNGSIPSSQAIDHPSFPDGLPDEELVNRGEDASVTDTIEDAVKNRIPTPEFLSKMIADAQLQLKDTCSKCGCDTASVKLHPVDDWGARAVHNDPKKVNSIKPVVKFNCKDFK